MKLLEPRTKNNNATKPRTVILSDLDYKRFLKCRNDYFEKNGEYPITEVIQLETMLSRKYINMAIKRLKNDIINNV